MGFLIVFIHPQEIRVSMQIYIIQYYAVYWPNIHQKVYIYIVCVILRKLYMHRPSV